MRKIFCVGLACGFALVAGGVRADDLMTTKEFLKAALGDAAKKGKETVEIAEADKDAIKKKWELEVGKSATFFFARDEAGALLRGATIVVEQGKEGPIRVGVVLAKDGKVEKVFILSFDEERGKPAAEQTFLKQYVGKGPDSKLKVGDDVDGITGATITSKAVTEAVRKGIALWNALVVAKQTGTASSDEKKDEKASDKGAEKPAEKADEKPAEKGGGN